MPTQTGRSRQDRRPIPTDPEPVPKRSLVRALQQGVTGDDRSVTGAARAVTTFALLTVLFSYGAFRWKRAQNVLQGVAVVIVRDGRVLDDVVAIERLRRDDVKEEARQQGIEDIRDVQLGVLEADGKFSFIRYAGERPSRGGQSEHTI